MIVYKYLHAEEREPYPGRQKDNRVDHHSVYEIKVTQKYVQTAKVFLQKFIPLLIGFTKNILKSKKGKIMHSVV